MTARAQPSARGSSIDLPHLSPEEAYVLVDVLDRIITALWDAYGDALIDLEATADPPDDQPPSDPDLDIPF